jgi:hypothetical protein
MALSIAVVERRARYIMCFVSLLLVLILLAFKAELITSAPSYKGQAWYQLSERAGFVITSEYADETECRRTEKPSAICRSGKSLMDEAHANAGAIERN